MAADYSSMSLAELKEEAKVRYETFLKNHMEKVLSYYINKEAEEVALKQEKMIANTTTSAIIRLNKKSPPRRKTRWK